jgi:1-acyl-sn-glycerol-3-phosphate acyltransferase
MVWLKAIYFWIMSVTATLAAILAIYCLIPIMYVFDPKKEGSWIHDIAEMWSMAIFALMPGWRMTLLGRENLPAANEPVVIVSNHESMADIWATYRLGVNFKWIAKIEMKNLFLVGRAMKHAGYVFVKRGDKQSHKESLAASKEWINRGVSMYFFPEGTRSETGEMRPFKIGAFKVARECGVSILPVVICGTRNLLSKGSGLPGKAHVKIKILQKMTGDSREDYAVFAEKVREVILTHRSELMKSE